MSSLPPNPSSIQRWTYADVGADHAYAIRKHVYEYFIHSLEKSHKDIEVDFENRIEREVSQFLSSGSKSSDPLSISSETQTNVVLPPPNAVKAREVCEQKVLAEFMNTSGLNMSHLRAALGASSNEVRTVMDPSNDEWPCSWNASLESGMPEDVRFSFNVLKEAVERTYGKELKEFELMWHEFSRKMGKKLDNPLDVVKFVRTVYNAHLSQNIYGALQNLIFLELEQEVIQGLGIVLFEMKTKLADLGVAPQQMDLVDEAIAKRKQAIAEGKDQSQNINDEALFNTLVDLLKTWEPKALDEMILSSVGRKHSGGDHLRPLNNQEIFSAIATLQQWAPKVLEEALGQPDGRLGQHIKDSLIKQAEALGVPAGKAKISQDDEQAVDLVDEVFTQNLYQRKLQQAARTILAQILFPSVKAAILNRRWFAEESHPARKFIVSVTDACAPAEGEVDQGAMEKARQAVDKLVAGFNEDVSIFEILTQEIQKYSGKEWTQEDETQADELARQRILKELREKWVWWNGPRPVMDFALQLGAEYLGDLDRNQERGSMKWGAALGALEQLLGLRSRKNERVKIDGALRDNLMKMLVACGWSGVRAHNRLAEQEDVIDAYYVHGKTDFDLESANVDQTLMEDLRAIRKINDNKNNEKPTTLQEQKPIHPETEVMNAVSEFEQFLKQNTPTSPPVLKKEQEGGGLLSAEDLEQAQMIFDATKQDQERIGTENQVPDQNSLFKETKPLDKNMIHPIDSSVAKKQADFAEAFQKEFGAPPSKTEHLLSTSAPEDLSNAPSVLKTTPSSASDGHLEKTLETKPETTSSGAAAINQVLAKNVIADGAFIDENTLEKIQNLQIGSSSTWMNTQGELVVVRLSWISPISMKYLFVNKNGARVLVGTPKELADMAYKGRFFPSVIPDGA